MTGELAALLGTHPGAALGGALAAGVASSISPCIIASVPLVVGFVGGYAGDDRRRALAYSLTFVLGMALTFTVLGIAAARLGTLFGVLGGPWIWVAAAVAIVLGLHLLIGFRLPSWPKARSALPTRWRGLLGALLLGAFFGTVSAPCGTPVLIGILTVIGTQSDALFGASLMFTYALGHGALLVAAGTSVAFAQRLAASRLAERFSNHFKTFAGLLLIAYGGYLAAG